MLKITQLTLENGIGSMYFHVYGVYQTNKNDVLSINVHLVNALNK